MALREVKRELRTSVINLYGLGNIVGKASPCAARVQPDSQRAETDSNVIIYGETGCGKDLAAKSIHEYSGRKGCDRCRKTAVRSPSNCWRANFSGM